MDSAMEINDLHLNTPNTYDLVVRLQRRILEIERCSEKSPSVAQEMHELLRQYSALAPITSCPPEVLSDILKAYVAFYWKDYDASDSLSSLFKWHTVMRVCRTWQETALATPQLWTRIAYPLVSPEFLRFCMVRSGDLPLHFRWSPLRDSIPRESEMHARPPSHVFPPPIAKLLASSGEVWTSLPRIKHLEIHLNVAMLEDIRIRYPDMQAVVAEELEELDITYFVSYSLSDADLIPLPTTHFPKLATLRLFCLQDSGRMLRPLLRATLTTLSLTALSSTMSPRALAKALQSVPLLQNLEISNYVETLNHHKRSVFSKTTELAHLRFMSLTEPDGLDYGLIQLLNYLTFPTDTELRLHVLGARPNKLRALLSRLTIPGFALTSVARPRSMVVGLHSSMIQDTKDVYVLYLWADSHPHNFPHVDAQDTSKFGTLFKGQDGKLGLFDALRYLNTAEVVSLGVRAQLRRDEWVYMFRALTRVERLFIEGTDAAYDFLEAFAEPLPQELHEDIELESELAQPPSQYLFPLLKELDLSDVELGPNLLPHAVACLQLRMQQGMGIEQLRVRHVSKLAPESFELIQNAGVARCVEIVAV
ncbi:hypothetical protein EIP86_011174 [Pleurotus ostreatoroseus]|nr:hypothetical protein EIP86_011174 [Pleurotus ostreatoroseus]